jgi:hypothetical protein
MRFSLELPFDLKCVKKCILHGYRVEELCPLLKTAIESMKPRVVGLWRLRSALDSGNRSARLCVRYGNVMVTLYLTSLGMQMVSTVGTSTLT